MAVSQREQFLFGVAACFRFAGRPCRRKEPAPTPELQMACSFLAGRAPERATPGGALFAPAPLSVAPAVGFCQNAEASVSTNYSELPREELIRRLQELEAVARSGSDAAAHDTAERLRAVVDTAVEAIMTIDEKGILESFNPAAEKMFGYTAAEIIGRNVSVLMPAPYREQHDRYIQEYCRTGQAKIIGIGREVVGRRKDGTVFPMDLSVGEVHLSRGRVFTGIARDITARKQVEAALRREHVFTSTILETCGALIVVLDRDGRIVRFNRACERATGCSRDEVKG